LTTASDPSPVREGDMLAGKYRVERVPGAGGTGVVVAALHFELGQRVAIEFLRPEYVKHAEAVQRRTQLRERDPVDPQSTPSTTNGSLRRFAGP
jgi:threonine dehydrogenase-like Zn-dependent dehydrogenase